MLVFVGGEVLQEGGEGGKCYSPARQAGQGTARPSVLLAVPTWQGRHWVTDMLPVVGRYVVGPQLEQEVWAVSGVYFPAWGGGRVGGGEVRFVLVDSLGIL